VPTWETAWLPTLVDPPSVRSLLVNTSGASTQWYHLWYHRGVCVCVQHRL